MIGINMGYYGAPWAQPSAVQERTERMHVAADRAMAELRFYADDDTCKRCGGTGRLREWSLGAGHENMTRTCYVCDGTGKQPKEDT